jgi:hypothetical protein
MRNMGRFHSGLLTVWALGCGLPESTVVESTTGLAEPAPSAEENADAPSEANSDEPEDGDAPTEDAPSNTRAPTRPTQPPIDPPPPETNADAMASSPSPPVQVPRSDLIEVSDGTFTPGPPPAPAADAALPAIVSVVGPPAVTNGGSAILHVQLSPPIPSPSFVVGLNGDTGYHTVTGADPDGDGVYDIATAVAAEATQTSLTFRVALSDAAGNVGAYREVEIPVIQSGTGDVKVTLSWDRLHDLDLRVIEPNGEEIRFENPASLTGGELDLDSGANCGQSAANSENIFWPKAGGPAGEYVVFVRNYQQCSPGAIDYTVRVVYDNTVSTFRGSFADGTASETDTADNPREVARFRR